MPARTITRWTHTGRLITVHAGVYAVGYASPSPIPVTMSAVLACGPAAGATHASATALWGLTAFPPIPEVSAPTDRRRPNIITHRSRLLSPQVLRRQYGVPTTAVPRTILDVAVRHTDKELVRLIDDARHRAILGPDGLAALCRASRRIRELIDPVANPTRSDFECRFLALCRRHGIRRPETNVGILPGIEVDILFAAEKVIVELDSWRFHRSHARFVADRARDRRTAAAGYVTLRYPWDAVCAGEAATAREVVTILRTRAPGRRSG